jgi:hypothetical protein
VFCLYKYAIVSYILVPVNVVLNITHHNRILRVIMVTVARLSHDASNGVE